MEQITQHILPPDVHLKKTLVTDVGVVFFYDNIVIFEAREGVIMSHKTGFWILLKGLNYLGSKRWVFISNRINSYSIKPMDYKYLNKVPTLRAVGIVNYSEVGHSNGQLEEKFCKKPFQAFDNLLDAAVWGKSFL